MGKRRSKFAPSPEAVERSAYVGRAGETFVLAELQIRQHNASQLPIDQGVDIISTYEGRRVTFQVKARSMLGDGPTKRALLLISAQAWERDVQPDYFVFVGFLENTPHHFVFSHNEVMEFIDDGIFTYKDKHKRYETDLIHKEGRWYLKNMRDSKNEITGWLNSWDDVV